MSVNLGDILLTLGVDDSTLATSLKNSESKATSWVGGIAGKVGGILAGTLATAVTGAAAFIGTSFAAGNELDTAFDTLIIKTGATGEKLAALETQFKKTFRDVPADAGLASDVMSQLYTRAGLADSALGEVTKKVLESSRMLKEDASMNAGLFTRVMGDWSLTGDQASVTMDKIYLASQKTGISMGNLMTKVVQFGSPMRLMGFTINDAIALFAKWEKEGVNAELVMGSLRIAAGKFADAGKPLRDSLLDTFKSIKNNTNATEALAKGMDVFGARAGPDMVAAIREGRFEIDDLINALGDADNNILKTAKSTEDWGEKLTKLKNKATVVLGPFGLKLLDIANVLLDKLDPALDTAGELFDKYITPGIDRATAAFDKLLSGDILGAMTTLFGPETTATVMTMVNALGILFGGTIGQAMPTLIAAASNFAAMFGPDILANIGQIAASGRDFFMGVLAVALPIVSELMTKFATWLNENGPNLAKLFGQMADGVTFLLPLLVGFFGIVGTLLGGTVDLLLNLATFWLQIFTGDFPGALNTFVAMLTGIGLTIENVLIGLLNWIASWFGTSLAGIGATWAQNWQLFIQIMASVAGIIISIVMSWVSTIWSVLSNIDLWDIGLRLAQGLANGISAGISAIRDAAVRAARAALDAAKAYLGIHSPASAPVVTDIGLNTAKGLGLSFEKGMKDLGPLFGQLPLSVPDIQPGSLAMPAPTTVQVLYQPLISTADELKAQSALKPILDRYAKGV